VRVWRNGSVYANPFLREFLYSHGLSHGAIAQLSAQWNALRGGDGGTIARSIPIGACASMVGMRGCQVRRHTRASDHTVLASLYMSLGSRIVLALSSPV
jgi:hypothetical protein